MAFGSYTSVDAVVKKYKLRLLNERVVTPAPDAPRFSEAFRAELDFTYRELPVGRSEIGSGELILFPILKEVWRVYVPHLSLFTHEPLDYDDDLTGTPDYYVCKRSEYGATIPEVPYLLVVEAKLDDFEKAWGQCLAAMLASQKLNHAPDRPVYGMTTNGKAWEIGVLLGSDFTREPWAYSTVNLDLLGQALHAVFRACRDMALAHTAPAPAANP
jgi:hypothetical protein